MIVKIIDTVNIMTDGAVLQFYIEQLDYDDFSIRLYTDSEISKSEIEMAFRNATVFTAFSGARISLHFEEDFFDVNNGGKFCYFRNLTGNRESIKRMNSEDRLSLINQIAGSIKLCLSALVNLNVEHMELIRFHYKF